MLKVKIGKNKEAQTAPPEEKPFRERLPELTHSKPEKQTEPSQKEESLTSYSETGTSSVDYFDDLNR